MVRTRKIGLIQDILASPLVYALQYNKIKHPFIQHNASLAENARMLATGEVDIALISPIDYARNSGKWEILPAYGITSFGFTGESILLFRQGLQQIRTIATDLRFPSEIVLTQIVFLEKFGDKPTFKAGTTPSSITPNNLDAVLLVGDKAIKVSETKTNILDLSDEWSDLTGMPFVHAFFAAKPGNIDSEFAGILMDSFSFFQSYRTEIANDIALRSGIPHERLHTHFNEEMRYSLDDLDLDGLREYYRHCYFHGILDEIPDIIPSQTIKPDNPAWH
jgi:chorismate dehydratase